MKDAASVMTQGSSAFPPTLPAAGGAVSPSPPVHAPMHANRGFIVMSPAGTMALYEMDIGSHGLDAPTLIDITGLKYTLYECTLFALSGRLRGYIASLEPLARSDQARAAQLLFGKRPLGLIRFRRIMTLPRRGMTQ